MDGPTGSSLRALQGEVEEDQHGECNAGSPLVLDKAILGPSGLVAQVRVIVGHGFSKTSLASSSSDRRKLAEWTRGRSSLPEQDLLWSP